MDDFASHMQAIGIPMADSRAVADYGKAQTHDQLYFAGGEHLALHAGAISAALRLPRRGALVLRLMERTMSASWEQYWRIHNDAFCALALLDLCTVRSVLREERRWPELSHVLDQLMVMACAHLALMIKMTHREKTRLHEQATDHLIVFQDDNGRTAQQQIDAIMNIEGLDKSRIDKVAFIRAAIVEPSGLDPGALVRHHDRLTRAGMTVERTAILSGRGHR
jgi:hypothetical protein